MDFLNKLMAKLGLGKNTSTEATSPAQPVQPEQTQAAPQQQA
jgi:hypothetical protein